jgi:hypothetical protein
MFQNYNDIARPTNPLDNVSRPRPILKVNPYHRRNDLRDQVLSVELPTTTDHSQYDNERQLPKTANEPQGRRVPLAGHRRVNR